MTDGAAAAAAGEGNFKLSLQLAPWAERGGGGEGGVVGIIGIRLDIDFTDQTTAVLETAPPLSALWLWLLSRLRLRARSAPRLAEQLGATAETASCTLELVALQYILHSAL